MTLYKAIRSVYVRDIPGAGFRNIASVAADEAFGNEVFTNPTLVNVAALAVAMGSNPVIHELKRDAIDLILDTDVQSVPAEPPRILERPFILASADERPLFGDTTEIGYYPLPEEDPEFLIPGETNSPGMKCLVGIAGHDISRSIFAPWIPRWGEDHITIPVNYNPLITDHDAHKAWCDLAFPFLLTYALLLEAEKTPIETTTRRRKETKSVTRSEKEKGRSGWTIQHISLTSRPVYSSLSDPEHREKSYEIDDKQLVNVRVRGFLRRQPCGPKLADRRWVYVAPFDSSRWVNQGPRRIIVDAGKAKREIPS